jgi:hypothetical protein
VDILNVRNKDTEVLRKKQWLKDIKIKKLLDWGCMQHSGTVPAQGDRNVYRVNILLLFIYVTLLHGFG